MLEFMRVPLPAAKITALNFMLNLSVEVTTEGILAAYGEGVNSLSLISVKNKAKKATDGRLFMKRVNKINDVS